MGFSGWICSFLFSVVAVSATAQEQVIATEGCISQAEMADIARSFQQFSSLANKEYCYDGSQTSQLLAGIMFMRKTQFAATMPKSTDELFSGAFASNWWNYFIGRINEFEVESSCQKGVVAFVYIWGNTMYVCPLALTPSMSSLDLASVFMHEARHIDGFPHTTCRSGVRAGIQGACDNRISDGGSYAVTVETYAQIGQYSQDVHPAMREYAKASAVVYADEAFDTSVRITRQSGFVLMTADQRLHQLSLSNGSVSVKALGQAPALGHIAKRAQFFVLYPDDKNLKASYLFLNNEGSITTEAGAISAEYNSLPSNQRAEWVDVFLGGSWYAKVKRSEVIFGCDSRSESTTSVSTGADVPVSILYPTGYDRAARSVSLLMSSGKVFDMSCSGRSGVLRDSGGRFDRSFKRVYKSGADVIGLGVDGKLYSIQGWSSQPLATSLDGQIYELAPSQSFSFFQ